MYVFLDDVKKIAMTMDDFLIASPMTWDLFFEAARGALDETYKRVTEHVNPTSWAGDPNGRNPGHCGVKSPPARRDVIGEYH